MYVRRLNECPEVVAGDRTRLRELLHPDRNPVAIRYSLARARLGPRQKSLSHRLTASEAYYFIQGQGVMHINEDRQTVWAGDVVYVPPGAMQWLENIGGEPIEFLCIVDPAWQLEQEELTD